MFYEGSTYLALATSEGARPDVTPEAWAILAQSGTSGPTGPAGESATISVGTVITGAPGTSATVVNSGTSTAAVLNFTIPQGATGANSGGSVGSSNSALSMYHSVSFSTNFYSVSNTNASATETASVLTWIPAGCGATSLTAYSQQVNTITVKMRMGTPSSMTDTDLLCSVSTGSTCTSTVNVPVPSGSFVDLKIEGPNGQQAGVWTALACN